MTLTLTFLNLAVFNNSLIWKLVICNWFWIIYFGSRWFELITWFRNVRLLKWFSGFYENLTARNQQYLCFCTRKIVQAHYLVLVKIDMAQSKSVHQKINVRKATDQLKVVFIHTVWIQACFYKMWFIKHEILNSSQEATHSSWSHGCVHLDHFHSVFSSDVAADDKTAHWLAHVLFPLHIHSEIQLQARCASCWVSTFLKNFLTRETTEECVHNHPLCQSMVLDKLVMNLDFALPTSVALHKKTCTLSREALHCRDTRLFGSIIDITIIKNGYPEL